MLFINHGHLPYPGPRVWVFFSHPFCTFIQIWLWSQSSGSEALHGLARKALWGHWGLAEEGEEQGVWKDTPKAPKAWGRRCFWTETSTCTVGVTVEDAAAKPKDWWSKTGELFRFLIGQWHPSMFTHLIPGPPVLFGHWAHCHLPIQRDPSSYPKLKPISEEKSLLLS